MSGRRLIALWSLWLVSTVGAAEVKIFRSESREAALAGTREGLSVSPDGTLALARSLERLASIDEPFVFAAAGHRRGWVVGTGNSGKVLQIDRDGEVSELLAADEPEVFAVWADDDGTALAGTSPQGAVYRIRDGESEVLFKAEENYIWDLERDGQGRLLVATGLRGRLYRVDEQGNAEVLYESPDSHVRAIAVQPDGGILLGTAGQGLIVRLAPDGTAETLHDASHPEVLSVVTTPGGKAYAALLASEASFVDLSSSSSKSEEANEDSSSGSATVVESSADTVGTRSSSFSGPRSIILEISSEGDVEQLIEFQSETVHALLWQDDELWIGTGQEGKLYRWRERQLIQETMLEERQIVALVAGPAGAAAVTSNAAAIYGFGSGEVGSGTFTSSVLDSSQVARFGSFRWQGRLPQGAKVGLSFRSGMSATPDATWTDWTGGGKATCLDCGGDFGRGQEVGLGGLAHGRYVQWRARLERGASEGPELDSSELTYRQENLAPKVESLEVLDPGEILVPTSFNPQSQTFEPWSPNRDGIFTTLRFDKPKNGDGRTKSLWKKGYRTLRWSAKDGNEDELWFQLEFRRDDTADEWLPMAKEIKESRYGFDATVLPDGIYRFRLTASDGRQRLATEALADTKVSDSVVVDHTPPELASMTRRSGALELELVDELSPLRRIALSVDASPWRSLPVADGLLDGRRERLKIEVPEGAQLVLLRVGDAAHNVVTFNLSAENNE